MSMSPRRTSRPCSAAGVVVPAGSGRSRPRAGQDRHARPAVCARPALSALSSGQRSRLARCLRRVGRRLPGGAEVVARRVRRPRGLDRRRRKRGRRSARRSERNGTARRGAGRVHAGARGAGGPLAERTGRGLPRGRERPARRHLRRGRRAGSGPRRRRRPRGAAGRHDDRRRARRRRRPGSRAVRDIRGSAGQRARDAPPQHRPLDDRRGGDQPVREPPPRRARPPARQPGRARALDGDGQHPRPVGSDAFTTATRTCSPATPPPASTCTARMSAPAARSGTSRRTAPTSTTVRARARHAAYWFQGDLADEEGDRDPSGADGGDR